MRLATTKWIFIQCEKKSVEYVHISAHILGLQYDFDTSKLSFMGQSYNIKICSAINTSIRHDWIYYSFIIFSQILYKVMRRKESKLPRTYNALFSWHIVQWMEITIFVNQEARMDYYSPLIYCWIISRILSHFFTFQSWQLNRFPLGNISRIILMLSLFMVFGKHFFFESRIKIRIQFIAII